jgi:trehalose 6-phosphate synthase/phosphatase
MKQRLFIVSNRLPLTVIQDGGEISCRPSSGGLISSISAWLEAGGQDDFSEMYWAGVPGCAPDVWQEAVGTVADYDYIPVFIEEPRYEQYYNGFSNSLLWPLFHYFPSFANYDPESFEAYVAANRQFADALIPRLRSGDVVWIHDYHHLPLAAMLREACPDVSIGFFLHIPFPSYELFRVIPRRWQEDLLQGMLGADFVCFHTDEYARHFEYCLEMVFQLKASEGHLSWQGRTVATGALPISIDFNKFYDAALEPGVQDMIAHYLRVKGDRRMIFSVDRLDYTKGIANRLRGYEKFLTDHPEYNGKVVFALNVVPSRDGIVTYADRKRLIDEFIGNFNSRLGNIGWQPILYQYSHLSFEELCGLYNACDMALITPLRDGMNLVAKEFVASRREQNGVLVLSEMAGAANELTEALLINPNDVDEVAEMIRAGLEMPEDEQRMRMESMQEQVRTFDVVAWAKAFFAGLRNVREAQPPPAPRRVVQTDLSPVFDRYTSSARRLLLLDYDGTLRAFANRPEAAVPDERILAVLATLSADAANEVYVVSGRDRSVLEPWLGALPVGLIASHGARIRRPGAEWQLQITEPGESWMPEVSRLMQETMLLVPESFIEAKEFSIAWHYRNVPDERYDEDLSRLHSGLLEQAQTRDLELLPGNKVLEMRSPEMNKGAAVRRLLKAAHYDFILAIGDDRTDEDMFRSLQHLQSAQTVKVGAGPTLARYRLATQDDVLPLLERLSGSFTR